jgi:hypothetical protein
LQACWVPQSSKLGKIFKRKAASPNAPIECSTLVDEGQDIAEYAVMVAVIAYRRRDASHNRVQLEHGFFFGRECYRLK